MRTPISGTNFLYEFRSNLNLYGWNPLWFVKPERRWYELPNPSTCWSVFLSFNVLMLSMHEIKKKNFVA